MRHKLSTSRDSHPANIGQALGETMILALYSYLGYYNICYIGEEVRDPGRTMPRAIMLSAVLVCVLFVALHLAMLGTVPWREALASATVATSTVCRPSSWVAFMDRGRCGSSRCC